MNEAVAPAPAVDSLRLRRLGATLIDLLVWGPTTLFVMLATGIVESAEAWVMPQPIIRLSLLVIGTYVLLHGYTLVTAGQTLGKRIVGVRIQSVAAGDLLPIWKLVVRAITLPLVGGLLSVQLVLPLYLLSGLFIFGPAQRCLHDYLVGSEVVRAP